MGRPGHTLLGLQVRVLWYLVIVCTTSLWCLRQTQRSSANDHWHGLFKHEWKFSGSTGSVNSNYVGFSGKGTARHTPGWAGLGEPLHSAKSRLRREHTKWIQMQSATQIAVHAASRFSTRMQGPHREKTKTDKYKLLCQQRGMDFTSTDYLHIERRHGGALAAPEAVLESTLE